MRRSSTKHALHHVAGGIAGSFFSRNNDLDGYWALGSLYRDAAQTANTLHLDLLAGSAAPSTPGAVAVAHTYGAFLRRSLARHGWDADELLSATLTLYFDCTPSRQRWPREFGDPCRGIVVLQPRHGKVATLMRESICWPLEPDRFSRRDPRSWRSISAAAAD